jgi:hypothetical protein
MSKLINAKLDGIDNPATVVADRWNSGCISSLARSFPASASLLIKSLYYHRHCSKRDKNRLRAQFCPGRGNACPKKALEFRFGVRMKNSWKAA